MPIRDLDKHEKRVMLTLVEEVLCGEYLSDTEYRIRLGLNRCTAHTLLQYWPYLDEKNTNVQLLLNNSMNEMCYGIHFKTGWPCHLSFTREYAKSIFHKWKGV